MQRESLGSRLGFILISAGCAIGIGNVWKFPYLCGQNGGGLFVLIYLFFLLILGLPAMTMEFAMGRAAQKSPVKMYDELEPAGSKWHLHGLVCMAGNYLLMMYYTTVAGWMVQYFFKTAAGRFTGLDADQVGTSFTNGLASPALQVGCMAVVVILGFWVNSQGLQNGLEKVTKVMMLALLVIMVILAINSIFLPGAGEGLKFYLLPSAARAREIGIFNVIASAMNQAFFTLSIGVGSMAIFGSYIGRDQALMGESVNVIILDTFVAICSGLIIFPACFAYGVQPDSGPGLIFFMTFAAFSTVLAVFENIMAMCMDMFGWSRRKSGFVNTILMLVLATPCALGFNVLSSVQLLGEGSSILDFEDLIVSNYILPIGAFIMVLFCTSRFGWGWKNFVKEADQGEGLKVMNWMRPYCTYVLPLIVILVFILGIL